MEHCKGFFAFFFFCFCCCCCCGLSSFLLAAAAPAAAALQNGKIRQQHGQEPTAADHQHIDFDHQKQEQFHHISDNVYHIAAGLAVEEAEEEHEVVSDSEAAKELHLLPNKVCDPRLRLDSTLAALEKTVVAEKELPVWATNKLMKEEGSHNTKVKVFELYVHYWQYAYYY
jgi:hypothetical protein